MPWRSARELCASTCRHAAAVLQWSMPRHSSRAAGHLLGVYLLLCTVSLGIGAGFWWFGAPLMLPLAGAELLLLGLAVWVGSRHVGDTEILSLAERELQVDHRCGTDVERAVFRPEWRRVEPAAGEGSLVELGGHGRRMRVGRYLRPEQRTAFARELRQAVRRECTRPVAQATHDTQLEPQR